MSWGGWVVVLVKVKTYIVQLGLRLGDVDSVARLEGLRALKLTLTLLESFRQS